MAVRPDSGSWTSLLKEMRSSISAEAGTRAEKQATRGTRTAKNMNVKYEMNFPIQEVWSRAHHLRLMRNL